MRINKMAFWDMLGNLLMWVVKGLGILFIIGIILSIIEGIGGFFTNIIDKVSDFFKDDGRTITTEQRMKELEAKRKFEKEHPGTKC